MKISVLALLLLAGLRGCFAQKTGEDATGQRPVPAAFSVGTYRATLRQFDARRRRLARQYQVAATPAGRAQRLEEARQLFLATLDSTVFPAWEGTPWTFYGASWEPRRGSIACGYFVTTSLHDAGLHLQRTLLAKQASEVIIKNLTSEAHITRYWGVPQADFVRQVRALGPGLYVLGLDFHAAFLRVSDNGAVQMVHSSYVGPGTVVREAADSSGALPSKYRVVGKVSEDDAFVRRWLLGQSWPVRGATVKE
ncbi:hypothetical protein MUN81_13160 [Hymenobacter sp. 5317J-9]|uniref:hypothetical protein n=1 Tax=Hymenobacter sp. 5317J-9 TaxID=2932250 RepID=UPI001FD69E7C|nr:hypothetical protein [Hymenobacter sp. 5317J-9]UOQ96201.1 hypothetical protein MUN81_13160 [Hymenobacter sp. 5317J-9]